MSIAMASRMEPKEEAFALCRQIIQLLKLDGNIGFDFMLDENDRPVLTDLNPRITATIVLYLAGGLNLPKEKVIAAIESAGFDARIRPEALTLEDFAKIQQALS